MEATKPLHLAIIPDGNRRWAAKRTLKPWKGHEEAITTIQSILEWCEKSKDIAILTFWLFSTENWKRDALEIQKLMQMLEEYLQKQRPQFLERNTRFLHSGRKDRIPPSLAKLITEIEEETKDCTNHTLHLALDYGGKNEILRAIQKLNVTQDITDDNLRSALDHPEIQDIDIIIRTSGECRTSNFFLWQSTYAEWFFKDQYFPDLTPDDVETIVEEFKKRKRRFGS